MLAGWTFVCPRNSFSTKYLLYESLWSEMNDIFHGHFLHVMFSFSYNTRIDLLSWITTLDLKYMDIYFWNIQWAKPTFLYYHYWSCIWCQIKLRLYLHGLLDSYSLWPLQRSQVTLLHWVTQWFIVHCSVVVIFIL